MNEFTLDELSYMAARAGIPAALARDAATAAVDRFHEVWRAERAHLPIAKDLAAEIERLLDVVPLAKNREGSVPEIVDGRVSLWTRTIEREDMARWFGSLLNRQNAGDPAYRPLAPAYDGPAWQAACDLVLRVGSSRTAIPSTC
ncbi:hypothetical protein [Brevundimonas naejangsanensis]